MKHIAPLSGSLMLISMFGIVMSTLYIVNFSITWAFTVGLISFILFIASFLSMTYAPVEEDIMIDEVLGDKKIEILTQREYLQQKNKA